MDICSHCGKSVSCDLNNFNDQKQCTCSAIGDNLIDDLGDKLNKAFDIQDAQYTTTLCTPHLNGDDINHIEEEILGGELKMHETESVAVASQKCLCKYGTFLPSSKTSSCSESSDEDDEFGSELEPNTNGCMECSHTAYLQSNSLPISLPSPLKLVSAMKGSREKQGMEPKKLTVTWAPDVYDPPPSSFAHVGKIKLQRTKNNKKNGKNKQKGKVTRGSTSKDKKQFRKLSGSSDRCYKSMDARDRLVYDDFDDPDEDFDVGSPDSYCGSSFLEKSFTKVHMSVAEAL